jgi:enamine deaminase RidA (YjgF/YER057c/UK114 family)
LYQGKAAALAADPSTDKPQAGGAEARLKELGIELPDTTAPIATYVSTALVGPFLYVAGHTSKHEDGSNWVGKVGDDCDLESGRKAARQAGLRILASVRAELGSLDRIVRLVKTLGLVNATTDFTEQPQVINGFSDLMVEIFGEKAGKGTRSAVGVGSLPGGAPVEIECVFQVRV